MKLTKAQKSLLGWIERRDEGGKGVRHLPTGAWTARVVNNLVAMGMVEIGRLRETGKAAACRVTPTGRAALGGSHDDR